MFEAAKSHGWMINNNIHRLDVVAEKTPPSNKSQKKSNFALSTPKIGVGIVGDQRDG